MTDLNTKAENYAAEKTNDLIAKAIAQAYADGYCDRLLLPLRLVKTK